MWLRIENLYTSVQKASLEERRWLHNFLTFEDKKAYFANGDPNVYLFRSNKFPTGLVGFVERGARKEGITIERLDARTCPHIEPIEDLIDSADLEWLKTRRLGENRDGEAYQYEAVRSVLTRSRGIISVPTGGGKGEITVGIAKTVPINWLFLVHRSHLRNDITERWKQRGDGTEPRWIGSKDGWDLGERLTLATFQTIHRALGTPECRRALSGVQGLIIDEVHSIGASTFQNVAFAAPNAYYRIGLSGTALERGDGKSYAVVAGTGATAYKITPQSLMEAGYVSTGTVYMYKVHQTHAGGANWNTVYSSLIANSDSRNRVLASIAATCPKPAILFVNRVKHGKELSKMMDARGVSNRFVWGAASDDVRSRVVKDVKQGRLDLIICNEVFQEGLDIRELESVVMGAGGESVISTIQRIGRGSRITDAKQHFHIYDIEDTGQKWLESHAKKRMNTYLRYGYDVRRTGNAV